MDEQVYWTLACDVRPDQMDELVALMNEMVESSRAEEPLTLNYEWSISNDGERCHLFERFADSKATMFHLATFRKKYAERFDAALHPTRMVVYGNADDEVRKALAGSGAEFLKPLGGFSR